MAPRPDPPTSTSAYLLPAATSPSSVQDGTASSTSTVAASVPTAPSTGNNNMLYMFTFLTALGLLLGVSCAIIARSITHRRRFRQRMERALAEGLPIPRELLGQDVAELEASLQAMMTGRQRRRRRRPQLGPKPVLWEISLDDAKGLDDWANLFPISTTVVHPTPNLPPTPPTHHHPPAADEEDGPTLTRWQAFKLVLCGTARAPEERPPRPPRATRFTFRNSATNILAPRPLVPPSSRHSGIVTTQPRPLAKPKPQPPRPVKIEDDDEVMLGFVIAMPDPSRPLHRPSLPQPSSSSTSIEGASELSKGKGRDEDVRWAFAREDEELPDIVFGVTDVNWRTVPRPVPKPKSPKKSFDSSTSE